MENEARLPARAHPGRRLLAQDVRRARRARGVRLRPGAVRVRHTHDRHLGTHGPPHRDARFRSRLHHAAEARRDRDPQHVPERCLRARDLRTRRCTRPSRRNRACACGALGLFGYWLWCTRAGCSRRGSPEDRTADLSTSSGPRRRFRRCRAINVGAGRGSSADAAAVRTPNARASPCRRSRARVPGSRSGRWGSCPGRPAAVHEPMRSGRRR